MLPCSRLLRRSLARCYVTTSSSGTSRSTAIYHSRSHNPWFNLAFEDWIFRRTPASQIVLFVYRNSPCVVIGRNQNPWQEINLPLLNKLNIPFVRRRSGGGTVYHDLGNSNYCVFVPRLEFERRTNAQLVSDALNDLDVRTLILSWGPERSHVSGSAFKLIQERAYHHGTMLIDARLQDLRGVLSSPNRSGMVSKGVESVPSPVRNLREWAPALGHEAFFEAVSRRFVMKYGGEDHVKQIDESELQNNEYLKSSYYELQTWDWQWGQTPEFTQTFTETLPWGSTEMAITSKKGLVTDFRINPHASSSENVSLDDLSVITREAITGSKYGTGEALQALSERLRQNGDPARSQSVADVAVAIAKNTT